MSNWRLLIPEQLKVGGLVYEITRPESIVDENDGEPCDGQTLSGLQSIQLLAQLSKQNESLTFLHEMLHAVDDFATLKLTEDEVRRLSQALLMVFVNNELIECLDCDEWQAVATPGGTGVTVEALGEPTSAGQVARD